jgi:two-component system LytT family response regulator
MTTQQNFYKQINRSAMDYLLKPVDSKELIKAVDKAEKKSKPKKDSSLDLALLLANIKNKAARIAVPTFEGLEMVDAEQIIKCTSDDSYTTLYMSGGKKTVVSRNLKDYEELLVDYNFLRIPIRA